MEGLDWKRGLLGIYALCWACLILLAFVACFANPRQPAADNIALLAISVAGPALLLLIIRDLDQ